MSASQSIAGRVYIMPRPRTVTDSLPGVEEPEEARDDPTTEGGKNVVEESALLRLFEPLSLSNPPGPDCDYSGPSQFCVQIHSFSQQRML